MGRGGKKSQCFLHSHGLKTWHPKELVLPWIGSHLPVAETSSYLWRKVPHVTVNGWEGSAGRNLYLEEGAKLGGWFPGLIKPLQSSMAPGQMGCPISTLLDLAQSHEREGLVLTHPVLGVTLLH